MGTPFLSGAGEEIDMAHLYHFGKGMLILLLMALLAFRGVPKLLYYVTRTKNRELFLVSVLTICFAVAWVTSSIGLSLSLGAFLAGLVVSESEYSNEAVGNVLPFQEIFTSFFFVSMGMLLNINFVWEQPLLILAIGATVMLLKSFVAGGSALLLGMPLRSAVIAGIALSQIGEFSFVVAHSGMSHGMVSGYHYQLFLAVSLLTMTVTPSLMLASHFLVAALDKLPLPRKIKRGYYYSEENVESSQNGNHVIIAGFGIRGRHIARAARHAGKPYLILELNPETVQEEKKKGVPIHYGDPSHPSVLHHAGIKTAIMIAVVINDPAASLNIIKMAKKLNPDIYIITRSRYFHEVQNLLNAGADDVIPDEFCSSLELFTRILQKCGVAHPKAAKHASELRMEGYHLMGRQNQEGEEPVFESKEQLVSSD